MIHLVAFLLRNVDHVEDDYQGDVIIDQLSGQIEVPFEIGGINHTDHQRGGFQVGNASKENIMGYLFLRTARGQAVTTGQVNQDYRLTIWQAERGFLLFNCDTRVIGDLLTGSREGIEDSSFTSVWVPGDRNTFHRGGPGR